MTVIKNYFSHNYTASQDPKIVRMKMALGYEGIGLYWEVVELLYREKGAPYKIKDLDALAYEIRADLDKLKKVIFDFGLFSVDEENFWNERILKNLESRNQKYKTISEKRAEAGKKGMAKRWAKSNKDNKNITKDNKSLQVITSDNQRKGKERKVKESKRKESKVNNTNLECDNAREQDLGKEKFGDFVRLSFFEKNELLKLVGNQSVLDELIEDLNNAIGSTDAETVKRKYANHYFVLRKFYRFREQKSPTKKTGIDVSSINFMTH